MKEKTIIVANKRVLFGRKVKKLRREGILPANIYGKGFESVSIQVSYKDFEKVFKEVGETQLLYVNLEKEEIPVLVHNVQKDPLTGEFVHVDFLKVNLKEKVLATVPVIGVGESPAEKQGLGTVVFYINELEVEALPTDIPEKIEVDVSALSEVDQAILVSDLRVDKNKIEIKANPQDLVAKVEAVEEEKEEVVAGAEEAVAEEGQAATPEPQPETPEENKEA